MNISLNKIDATLKNSKGYYEVLAKKENQKRYLDLIICRLETIMVFMI